MFRYNILNASTQRRVQIQHLNAKHAEACSDTTSKRKHADTQTQLRKHSGTQVRRHADTSDTHTVQAEINNCVVGNCHPRSGVYPNRSPTCPSETTSFFLGWPRIQIHYSYSTDALFYFPKSNTRMWKQQPLCWGGKGVPLVGNGGAGHWAMAGTAYDAVDDVVGEVQSGRGRGVECSQRRPRHVWSVDAHGGWFGDETSASVSAGVCIYTTRSGKAAHRECRRSCVTMPLAWHLCLPSTSSTHHVVCLEKVGVDLITWVVANALQRLADVTDAYDVPFIAADAAACPTLLGILRTHAQRCRVKRQERAHMRVCVCVCACA